MAGLISAISQKIKETNKKDENKLQSRISRRMSRTPIALGIDVRKLEDEENDENKRLQEEDFEEDEDDLIEDHEKWENPDAVLLYMLGYVVGLSNVWRFPFLCYTYGGSAFLIPYFVFLLLFAYPFVYLELLVGQFTQVGSIASWKVAPLFKGVGMCMCLLAFMFCFNVQSVLAWCGFYIFQSMFYYPLPWISCDNGFGKLSDGTDDEKLQRWIPVENDNLRNWHTEHCREFYADAGTDEQLQKSERLPGAEYLRGRVQRMWRSGFADEHYNDSNGKEMFGLETGNLKGLLEFNTDTMICLSVCIIIILILISRGTKLNTKFLSVCVCVPYVVLMMLFYRATGLHGAWFGIQLLFEFKAKHLADTDTWRRAAEQVFVSTGCGLGVHLTLGSYSDYNRNVLKDATVVVLVNTFTSLFSATVIFMFLGHIQLAVNRKVETFIASGPELAFEVMADVLGILARANFYSIFFYLLLFLLGLTTIMSTLICIKASFYEVLPVAIKYKQSYRLAIFAVLCGLSTFASLVNLSRAGLHAYNFQENFIGEYSVILCSFLFLIGIVWVWGLQDLVDGALLMGIRVPGIYFQICWKFIGPTVCTIVAIGYITSFNVQSAVRFDNREIKLSKQLLGLGYTIALGPFALVILGAIHAISKAKGKNCKEKFFTLISPTKDHKEIFTSGKSKRTSIGHYFYLYAAIPGAKLGFCCRGPRLNKVVPELTESWGNVVEIIEPQNVTSMTNEDVQEPPAEDQFTNQRMSGKEKLLNINKEEGRRNSTDSKRNSVEQKPVDEGKRKSDETKHITLPAEDKRESAEDRSQEEDLPASGQQRKSSIQSKKIGGCKTQ